MHAIVTMLLVLLTAIVCVDGMLLRKHVERAFPHNVFLAHL